MMGEINVCQEIELGKVADMFAIAVAFCFCFLAFVSTDTTIMYVRGE